MDDIEWWSALPCEAGPLDEAAVSRHLARVTSTGEGRAVPGGHGYRLEDVPLTLDELVGMEGLAPRVVLTVDEARERFPSPAEVRARRIRAAEATSRVDDGR